MADVEFFEPTPKEVREIGQEIVEPGTLYSKIGCMGLKAWGRIGTVIHTASGSNGVLTLQLHHDCFEPPTYNEQTKLSKCSRAECYYSVVVMTPKEETLNG